MTTQPYSFRLPIEQFDLSLLPPTARVIGSDAFKDAVVKYFAEQYGGSGQTVLVTVDEAEIAVMQLPADTQLLDFVLTMLQGGRITEAVPFLEAMIQESPNDVEVLYNLGIARSELGQFDEAIVRLKRAVQLQPMHARAWTGIGVAYERMGKREQSLQPFQKAVEVDPADGYALRNLGGILLALGRVAEGLPYLRKARQVMPHDPQATYGLAAALDRSDDEANRAEADELFTIVIERWPGSNLAELAREARTKIAHRNLRGAVGGGLRPDVMMYIAGALDTFDKVGPAKAQQITFEIALKGQSGLDINDSDQKYTLKTLSGTFSGLHLVAMMYAGLKRLDPTLPAGADFQAEYDAAIAMRPKA